MDKTVSVYTRQQLTSHIAPLGRTPQHASTNCSAHNLAQRSTSPFNDYFMLTGSEQPSQLEHIRPILGKLAFIRHDLAGPKA